MKTTKANFELFREYCVAWQKKLGLTNWAIYHYHKDIEDSYANTAWKVSDGVAAITLNTTWDTARPLNETELNRLAFHEVCHVLFAQLTCEAVDRYTNQTAIDIAEHSIIRTLESLIPEFAP